MHAAFSTTGVDAASFFTGIVTARFVDTCEFYFEHFGFRPVVANDDHMLLARADGSRLGLLRAGRGEQPAALQTASRGAGVWFTLEVDDPDAVFARLSAAGVEIVAEPEFTLSGVRRFVARDPNGVLIYVTEKTLATPLNPSANADPHHDHHHGHSFYGLSGH